MILISGGADQYTANACAQVASTSNAWTQVIAPASNTAGIYLARVTCWSNGTVAAHWRAHTALPASDADGVGVARVDSADWRDIRPEIIIPAGQGLYVSSDGASQIFYRVLS